MRVDGSSRGGLDEEIPLPLPGVTLFIFLAAKSASRTISACLNYTVVDGLPLRHNNSRYQKSAHWVRGLTANRAIVSTLTVTINAPNASFGSSPEHISPSIILRLIINQRPSIIISLSYLSVLLLDPQRKRKRLKAARRIGYPVSFSAKSAFEISSIYISLSKVSRSRPQASEVFADFPKAHQMLRIDFLNWMSPLAKTGASIWRVLRCARWSALLRRLTPFHCLYLSLYPSIGVARVKGGLKKSLNSREKQGLNLRI